MAKIALNITKTATNYPHMVKWSDAAVPGAIPASWDETSVTGDAGELDIAETSDVIVDGLPLGDAFIIYKERSAYSMTFIGQPSVFRFQRLPNCDGMLARGCAAMTPLGHVVLTSGGYTAAFRNRSLGQFEPMPAPDDSPASMTLCLRNCGTGC